MRRWLFAGGVRRCLLIHCIRAASHAMMSDHRPPAADSSAESPLCTLCDEEYEDWTVHAQQPRHRARHAVCKALVQPEKHDAIMMQLWEHIHLDFSLVEEINQEKIDRRRGRLASTLKYLRDANVVQHAFFQRDDSQTQWMVSRHLTKYVLLGSLLLHREATDRIARLFPKATDAELKYIVDYALSRWHLIEVYDFLELDNLMMCNAKNDIIALPAEKERSLGESWSSITSQKCSGETLEPKDCDTIQEQEAEDKTKNYELQSSLPSCEVPWGPTVQQKATILLAMLGELENFTSTDRPHSVGNKAAADALVLNVLSVHAMENIVSELVHFVLQKIVEEGTPVWKEYLEELPNLMRSSCKAQRGCLALSEAPNPKPLSDQIVTSECCEELVGVKYTAAAASSGVSNVNYQDIVRGCVMDVTVPNPVSRTAFFAVPLPKVSLKPTKAPESASQSANSDTSP